MGDAAETWGDGGMGWSLLSASVIPADFPALCGVGGSRKGHNLGKRQGQGQGTSEK